MKVLLAVIVVISGISISNVQNAEAQERAQMRAQVSAPAQIRQRDRAITIINPADIHTTAALAVDVLTPKQARVAAQSSPRSNAMGRLQQAPQGKLNITLTPQTPARENRAYLYFYYPQSIYLEGPADFASFTNEVIPGHMTYKVKLEQGKKYLVEIMADPWGESGGHVEHTIGSATTVHEFAMSQNLLNISRVIQSSQNGWVTGTLRQADDPPFQWRFHSVKITEMD